MWGHFGFILGSLWPNSTKKAAAAHGWAHSIGEQPFVYLPETIPLRAPPEERNPCIGCI